ncbi:NAD-dependent epimerase/dehydratase family protein [Altericista sp. CCNU0014]|uniref:NAD-dependent epimerase/dehydratase family protein n=1 Tax=Altericista sp. CCNU0014 TaxID=3082949 RepID=UPI00384D87BD
MDLRHKTLLITGIGNFIGRRTAEMALERGIKVRGLEKDPDAARQLESKGIEVVIGSVTEPTALERACQDVDFVFHTESVQEASGDIKHFRAVNVDGTIAAVKAARRAKVRAFVHLSSVMVYGFNYPDGVTETGTLRGENNPFCQTKIESETEVFKYNDPSEFGAIAIRAGDIYGPGADAWVLRPLKLMEQKVFVLIDGGRGTINHLYIDNLADGVFLTLEKEAYGEVFNLTDGAQTSWKDYYLRLAEIGGMPQPSSMPGFLVKKAAQFKGKEVNFSPAAIDFVTRQHTYSIEKARRVLHFVPQVGLDEGMARTAAWLRSYAPSPALLTRSA